jgi:hypothetical protein
VHAPEADDDQEGREGGQDGRGIALAAAGLAPAVASLSTAMLTSAQVVMTSTKAIGSSVNLARRPVFLSHTPITSSVMAARSWFDAPNSVQYSWYAFWSLVTTSRSGAPTVSSVPATAPPFPFHPKSSWTM